MPPRRRMLSFRGTMKTISLSSAASAVMAREVSTFGKSVPSFMILMRAPRKGKHVLSAARDKLDRPVEFTMTSALKRCRSSDSWLKRSPWMVSVMNLAPLLWTMTISHSIARSVSMIGARCS